MALIFRPLGTKRLPAFRTGLVRLQPLYDGGFLEDVTTGRDRGRRLLDGFHRDRAALFGGLRVFEDADGKMNRSLLDDGLGALVVSQFTLYGDCRKGMRPGFTGAAHPSVAEPLYERFCEALAAEGVVQVARGVFGADMAVSLLNDGPVTLVIDTP